jgi:hypothetical protein
MGKPRTKRKYATKKSKIQLPEQLQQEIDWVTDRIKSWTTREIAALQEKNNFPICIPTANGFKIGLYRLHVMKNKTCEIRDNYGQIVHVFGDQTNAILYMIYLIKRRFPEAERILTLDHNLNLEQEDAFWLQRSLDRADKNQDYPKADICRSRLNQVKLKVERTTKAISREHHIAKFKKVWL